MAFMANTAPPLGLPQGGVQAPPLGLPPTTSGTPGARQNRVVSGGGAGETARRAMKAMGVPSFANLFKSITGGGEIEFGNAGSLRGLIDELRGDVGTFRGEITDPTSSQTFQTLMSLANERTAAGQHAADREERIAAGRRGYAGGYDPRKTESDRMKALASTGLEGVLGVREQAGGLYEKALGGLTPLATTYAELPTKYLSAYGNLLGGLNFGDFYRTALQEEKFKADRRDLQRQRNTFGPGQQIGTSPTVSLPPPTKRRPPTFTPNRGNPLAGPAPTTGFPNLSGY